MSTGGFLNNELSRKTSIFGLRLWIVIGIGVGAFIVLILFFLSIWLSSRKKSRRRPEKPPSNLIPVISKEIKEVRVDRVRKINTPRPPDGIMLSVQEKSDERDKADVPQPDYRATPKPNFETDKANPEVDKGSLMQDDRRGIDRRRRAPLRVGKDEGRYQIANKANVAVGKAVLEGERRGLLDSNIGDKGSNASAAADSPAPSPAICPTMPEVSHLGWGHWYTLRDLEAATDSFSDANVLGEGGYGIVYRGQLPDGTLVAVKNLLNNRGQAEREFKVEVEAIGRVRHKNLVRLLGYCAEGYHRMLVYEYVDNGNLEQWLHGHLGENKPIPWDGRMKIILGTAKGLAYLHEGLEPKVVHRDVKSSNILIDTQWNAKVSDFGLAKLLGAGKSHVTTRVMGTFGYVAPEYASTGLLNERSDVYSFGVLLMELITGRDPIDFSRPPGEVNLVDWLKMMVGSRRSEEVVDPKLEVKPPPRSLKRALLVSLRCVDPDSDKRPKMGYVVHMLEADDSPFRDERRVVRDVIQTKDSPYHQITLQGQGIPKDSPVRKALNKDSPAHKAVIPDDSRADSDSPNGPGFRPRWVRYEG